MIKKTSAVTTTVLGEVGTCVLYNMVCAKLAA